MQALPAAAVFASDEMLFVIPAHLRRQAGNIVAPPRQDFAYDGINTLTHIYTDLPTTGLVALLPTGPPASPGYPTGDPAGFPAPFPPLTSQLQDGYSARKGAPIRYRLHFHHSLCAGIGRVPYSTGGRRGWPRAASPTRDTVRRATPRHRGSTHAARPR